MRICVYGGGTQRVVVRCGGQGSSSGGTLRPALGSFVLAAMTRMGSLASPDLAVAGGWTCLHGHRVADAMAAGAPADDWADLDGFF